MCSAPTKKFSGQTHQGEHRSSPYPVSRLAPATELVDLAHQIAQADETIQAHVSGKLTLIAKQIQALQEQAHHILQQAQRDQTLHRAQCQSQRIIGKTYYLYEKQDQAQYFSLLSPQDWHGSPPHAYQGAYRLEPDMSWLAMDETDTSTSPQDADSILHDLLKLPNSEKDTG